MKLAIVHDWLVGLGGAERVLIELHKLYPQAPIYTLFYDRKFIRRHLPDAEIRSSWLQKIPLAANYHRQFSLLMPSAIESFDLSDFDTVLSSSVIFSKGLVLRPKTRHICYCYSPARQLWDWNAEYGRAGIARHFLRLWDRASADRVDKYIAISQTVAARIKKYYGRDAEIVYPPTLQFHSMMENVKIPDNYYLIVSRLYRHKNIGTAVEAFNKLGYNLMIIGKGPELRGLRRKANKNIKFLGYQNDSALAAFYARCRALIMPQEEDFGLTPLEAMSFGKPVLALRKGGAVETILEGVNGEFFEDPIPEALAEGVKRLDANFKQYSADIIAESVQRFSTKNFRNGILQAVNNNQ